MRLLETLREFFAAQNLQAFLVGGSVRDILRDQPGHDLDVVVVGDAASISQSLAEALKSSLIPLDDQRGIFRVVLPREEEETSQERTEREPWIVDLSGIAHGIEENLGCRDFTINAMAVPFPVAANSPSMWHPLDPFGGQADLAAGVVRALSAQVFQDDPLRLLRAVRLAAQLRFRIEPATLTCLSQDAVLIAQVSAERVRDELLSILAQPDVGNALELLDRHGLLSALIPELTPAKGVTQPFEHYWDVYDHSLQCVVMAEQVLSPQYRLQEEAGQAIPWEPWLDGYFAQEVSDGHSRATLLKLAALLHDVAKPETKTVEPSGRARFLGHPSLGAEKTEEILQRLRLSGHGIAMIRALVEHHLRPSHLAQRDQLPTTKAIYRYFRDLGDVAVDTLYINLADYLAARGPTLDLEEWRFHCTRIARTLDQGVSVSAHPNGTLQAMPQQIPKLVDGDDLVNLFSLQPGPHFRPLLEAAREAQAAGEVVTREEALAFLQQTLRESTGKDREAMRGRHV